MKWITNTFFFGFVFCSWCHIYIWEEWRPHSIYLAS